MKKKVLAALMASALMLSVTACSNEAGNSGGDESADGATKISYIVMAKTDQFWTTMEKGAYAYAGELGIDLEFQAPEKETDVEKQVQMMENAIIKGFDAIILSPADSTALIPSIIKANEAGIPVVLVNNEIDMDELARQGGEVATYVGISQYDASAQAGQYAAENISDGKILYLEGIPGMKAHEDRLAGFKDQCGSFQIIASQTAKCDRNEAFNVTQNVLQKSPEVNVIWATNAEMGQGAVQAIEQLGMTGQIAVFDFDASDDDLDAIEAGTLMGTVAQYPNVQASAAIDCALKAIAGEELEEHTQTDTKLITKDNLEEYRAEMAALDA